MHTLDRQHCVVTMPDRDWPPVVVVYGGLYGCEGHWFLKKIPKEMFESVVFVLPKSYTFPLLTCLNELKKDLADDAVSSWALCGYSRGGIEVYRHKDLKPWNLVGLIDVSSPDMGKFKDDVLDAFASKIRCTYWAPHWTDYGRSIPDFRDHLKDLKVNMIEENVNHFEMPTFFFQKFGKDFSA